MRGIEIPMGYWRDTAQPLLLGFMSAYVTIPLMMFLLHIRLWTFLLLVATVIVMTVIERYGYSPPVALLALRARIAGRVVKRRKSMFSKRLDS